MKLNLDNSALSLNNIPVFCEAGMIALWYVRALDALLSTDSFWPHCFPLLLTPSGPSQAEMPIEYIFDEFTLHIKHTSHLGLRLSS